MQQRTDVWTSVSQITDTLWAGGAMSTAVPDVDALLRLQMPTEAALLTSRSWKALLWLPIPDGPPAPNFEWLNVATSFLGNCENAGYKTYIHCAAGVSRTGFVLAGYLMNKNWWTLEETMEYLQDKRPAIWPNTYFMERLRELEADMFSLPPEDDRE